MKKHLTPFALLLAAMPVQGAILVDYDDGIAGNSVHENNINDGDFGLQTNGSTSTTLPWVDLNGVAATTSYTTAGASGTGSPIHYVGQGGDILAIDTGFRLTGSDTFNASFMWNGGGSESASMVLYYTASDLMNDPQNETILHTTNSLQSSGSWATVQDYGFTTSGGTGRKLFLRLMPGSLASPPQNVQMDNIYLETVPEPASAAPLLGLLGLGMFLRRRK